LAKNEILKPKVAADIDGLIERVLEDIGNPEPPLDLRLVRELLRLDRSFYSLTDPSLLQETVSKLRIGSQQVLLRPALLIEAIRKFDLRALYIPDQRRILIDETQPKLKHRWNEAHEIGHSLIPWHEGAMLGDDEHTLVPSCHQKLENEANFAAARLTFLRDRFSDEANSCTPTLNSLKQLSTKFGNTNASTLWRCIEIWGDQTPVVGLITGHPQVRFRKENFDPANPCRHFIQSPLFLKQFSRIKETDVFQSIVSYCHGGKGGPLGGSDIVLKDDNGHEHEFEFESFSFHHSTYTIGVYKRSKPVLVAGF
jgi:hypothetical protein